MKQTKITPITKDYIWGRENWLFSGHRDGNNLPPGITDPPVLIKHIAAREKLSVQVHPGDDYAREKENDNGKTEMWIITAVCPNSSIIYGLNRTVTREEFSRHIENGTLLEICKNVSVKAGDVFFIRAGTLHSIGGGIELIEVQQNSNVTYRVFDFDRVGADGNKRPLHIAKALDVVDLSPAKAEQFPRDILGQTEDFRVTRANLSRYAAKRNSVLVEPQSLDTYFCRAGEIFELDREQDFIITEF